MTLTPDQKVIVDVAIASAVTSRGGNLCLLLPLVREECRAAYPSSEFVLKVDQIVEGFLHHPVYRDAFMRQRGATLASTLSPSFTLTRCTAWVRSLWARIGERIDGWSALPTEDAEPVEAEGLPTATDLDAVATEEKARAATEPERPGNCGFATTMNVLIAVRCVGGRMLDVNEIHRAPCPSCLGAYYPKRRAS
jgi:hypothetical protein